MRQVQGGTEAATGRCPSPFPTASMRVLYPFLRSVCGEFTPLVIKMLRVLRPVTEVKTPLHGGGHQMAGHAAVVPHFTMHRESQSDMLDSVSSPSQAVLGELIFHQERGNRLARKHERRDKTLQDTKKMIGCTFP